MFPKIGGKPPKWMVKIMENPIKMEDLGGPPLFLETPSCEKFTRVLHLFESCSFLYIEVAHKLACAIWGLCWYNFWLQ